MRGAERMSGTINSAGSPPDRWGTMGGRIRGGGPRRRIHDENAARILRNCASAQLRRTICRFIVSPAVIVFPERSEIGWKISRARRGRELRAREKDRERERGKRENAPGIKGRNSQKNARDGTFPEPRFVSAKRATILRSIPIICR